MVRSISFQLALCLIGIGASSSIAEGGMGGGIFGGRYVAGGHPYHSGYHFIPPSSAYEAISYYPPFHYGIPSYYAPASYLAPGYLAPVPINYVPAFPNTYPYIPVERASSYYMSAHSYYYISPW